MSIDVFFTRDYTVDTDTGLSMTHRRELVRALFYYDMVRAGYRPLDSVAVSGNAETLQARCKVQRSDVYLPIVSGHERGV